MNNSSTPIQHEQSGLDGALVTAVSEKFSSRFEFGKNWAKFLSTFSIDKLEKAKSSLCKALNCENLTGLKFLDIGSCSGLFSFAAYQLGAKVYSFDYDQDSVVCTLELKNKYAPNNNNWFIEQGSILDAEFIKKYAKLDIVYSWGVLHHTGNMYLAFENISKLLNPNGKLFISIYNDQGNTSKHWA